MAGGDATAALRDLGFSEIEAVVYCFLLGQSPATGYRIAKGVGKAAANVYAAIESLAQKGALLVDDGESRLCRAVPPSELCAAMNARRQAELAAAQSVLEKIAATRSDQRVYQIERVEQAFARAEAMIDGATSHLLIDAFPEPLSRISAALRQAIRRGVVVAIEAYDAPPPAIEDAIIVRSPLDTAALSVWPGQQMNIVADAREHLLALFDRNCAATLQAVWSNSAYLSCLHHSLMAATLLAQQARSEGYCARGTMSRLAKLALLTAQPPGLGDLLGLYTDG